MEKGPAISWPLVQQFALENIRREFGEFGALTFGE
jgi:hypothetical protein